MTWTNLLIAVVAGLLMIPLCNGFLIFLSPGNPRSVAVAAARLKALRSASPTMLFRWRKGMGLHVIFYDEKADEEREMPSAWNLDPYSSTYWVWAIGWGDEPLPKFAAERRARLDLVLRVLCCLFQIGTVIALVYLAFAWTWLWAVALAFLLVHELMFMRVGRHLLFARRAHFIASCAGVFVFLQGGPWEAVAVCAVGGFFIVVVIASWAQLRNEERSPELYAQLRRYGMWP
ncbi:hypothetical protein LO763_10825 [Glycomyces sp. A-F 0318]|uniref:hypothetical protein n=1 Tax=Glycomyces amatae TaxID=2881355 RepID=UPI001E5D2FB4|nr:hypothetical protein [Glycomyces amatae]MCD0444117.1 hypothetical protein [Glycomyces amatae]